MAEFLKRATPPNVTVINKGLSNRSSIEEFHIPLIKGRKSRNISTLEPELVADYETIIRKVEILPLDEFDYKDIGFIKIDVEGHELSVLKGAQKTIERSRPVIQVEILADQATLRDHQVIRFLSEAGYDMMSLQNNLLRLYKPSETISSSRNFIFLPQSG